MIAVRANTITQVSLICLMLFLLVYLWTTARKNQLDRQHPTWPFIRAITAGLLVILVSTISSVSESWPGYVALHFRAMAAVYFYFQIGLFLYALPPFSTVSPQELRIFSVIMRSAVGLEVIYFFYRIVPYWQTGLYTRRPPWTEIPVVCMVLWTAALALRRLLDAEQDAHPLSASVQEKGRLGRLRRILDALFRPRSDVAQVYRWFAFVTSILIFMVLFFSVLPYRQLPLWVDIALDGSLTVGVTIVVFVYLRYQLVSVSLEMRLLGVGLTVFLLMTHVLAWGISLTFLAQELPGVAYAQVFGSAQQPDYVMPLAYRDTALRLGDLLRVVIWFQIGGSLVFLAASALYYRRTIIDALSQLLLGFEQAKQGNLAHRIPQLAWQDEFSHLASAFNGMAGALQSSSQEVQRYQDNLEDLVEERTQQLADEIEQRKALEVMQGIQAERNRIAQETHDGLLQSLAGVRIRLRRGGKLSRRSPEVIEAELAELADELSHSTVDLRRLINDLKLDILELGLANTIRRTVKSQERAYGVQIHTVVNFDERALPISSRLGMLRLVQEAISNACKYSGSKHIWLSIEEDAAMKGVTVTIKDAGRGFDLSQAKGSGWGLGNMQQRADEIGGAVHIESELDVGTVVRLRVPYQPPQDPSAADFSDGLGVGDGSGVIITGVQ